MDVGGKGRGLAHLVFPKLKRDLIVPCKHIVTLNSGETGEEKLFKPKNIVHIETTGNTFRQNFIKCFYYFIISVLRIWNRIVVV